MGGTILGLDLGTNSIGWALLGTNDYDEPNRIVACGVRIFQEAVDAKTRTPKNQKRRQKRAARRVIARRKMRRLTLENLLTSHGMLPSEVRDAANRSAAFLNLGDPYLLRKRALDERLSLFELGRVLMHLVKRRGFQSNRKGGNKDEDSAMKAEISDLRKEIETSGLSTLGAYLATQPTKRKRHTDRAMYQHEFNLIWSAQQRHYPDLLTEPFKARVARCLFFQRPLKVQKFLVGKCSLETNRPRAPRASLDVQRFRIWQDINNLTVRNPDTFERRPLTKGEAKQVYDLLSTTQKATWKAIRKALKLQADETFNFEEAKRDYLLGNKTEATLRKALGALWRELGDDRQEALVTDLLTIDNEEALERRLLEHWKIEGKIVSTLLQIELEPGYGRLSRKAIRKLLPHLSDGATYPEACQLAGYGKRTARTSAKLPLPPDIRNPVVQKALFEARKVVNTLIQAHGLPNVIRVEMARDMKLTRRQKEEVDKKNRELRKVNERVVNILTKEFGISNPRHADIQRYRLWEECKCQCPYTGRPISREMLFTAAVNVEHILPFSRSLDDSYMNKTLCLAEENQLVKKNSTPFEAYGGNPEKYAEIVQRAKILPFAKRQRFEARQVEADKFVQRQLNDTRYITTEVRQYLETLGTKVQVGKGELTAALRRRWGLNGLLGDDVDTKTRDDHRHHAVDATVIAITSPSLLAKLSRLSGLHGDAALWDRDLPVPLPWENFVLDVSAHISQILVSHAINHKISDALHEETALGYIQGDDVYVTRKSIETLKAAELRKVRDSQVVKLLEARLAECDGDEKKAWSAPVLHVDGKTPIKSVRVEVRLSEKARIGFGGNPPAKYHKLGSNHHVELLRENETGKIHARYVSNFEAARRAKTNGVEQVVQTDHGPNRRLVMVLYVNDIVRVDDDFYRVQKLSSGTADEITLRKHTVARVDTNSGLLRKTPTSFLKSNVMLVTVDTIGRWRPHDKTNASNKLTRLPSPS